MLNIPDPPIPVRIHHRRLPVPQLTIQRVQRLHVLLRQLKSQSPHLQIRFDPRRRHRLDQHHIPSLYLEPHAHRRRRHSPLLRDPHHHLVLHHLRVRVIPSLWSAWVAQRRVHLEGNVPLCAERHQSLLVVVRVTLALVDHRRDARTFYNALNLHAVEVGDANVPRQPRFAHLLHRLPRVLQPHHLAIVHSAVRQLRKARVITIAVERHRPVDEVQVHVRQAQIRQRLFRGRHHVARVVLAVPQLAGDEQLLARHHVIREYLLQRDAHLWLVAVRGGAVHVAVAAADGQLHRHLHFAGLGEPGLSDVQSKCECFFNL